MSKKVKLTEDAYITPQTKAGEVLDLEDNLADRLVEMGVAKHHKEAPKPEPIDIPEGEPSEDWTVKQLDAFAERESIDLGDAKTKAEKLAALNSDPDQNPGA